MAGSSESKRAAGGLKPEEAGKCSVVWDLIGTMETMEEQTQGMEGGKHIPWQ